MSGIGFSPKFKGFSSLEEKGRYVINSSKRYKLFAYRQNGEKYYGMKDKFTGVVYKRIDEQQINYTFRRFAVESEDKILERMYIYSKEGIANRAMTAKGNIVSAIDNLPQNYDYLIEKNFGMSRQKFMEKINKKTPDGKWIDFAVRNSDFIDSFFEGYRAEMAEAPPEDAGFRDFSFDNQTEEKDASVSDDEEKIMNFLKDLSKTFKI